MKRIKLIFWGLCIGLTVLWLVADPIHPGSTSLVQARFPMVMYTGILAMGVMSVSMMLALRSVAIEPYLGGLDKSYRLHKWLGVAGLLMAIGHWLWISAPQPPRPRGKAAASVPALLHALQNPARSLGAWCLYALIALVALALLRWFPYRWFLKTHRLLAVV